MKPGKHSACNSSNDQEQPSWLAHHLINVMVALVCASFAYWNIRFVFETRQLNLETFLYLAIFLRNTSIAVLFLVRRPARASSKHVKEWLVAIVGTFAGFAYTQKGAQPLLPPYLYGMAYVLMGLAIVLSIAAVLSLGRSFGIVPANRGIKTRGLYAIVRHPIYACYILYDIIFLSLRFSWLNLFIFGTFSTSLYLRAVYEERILRHDKAYRQYAQRTSYMFIPKII